MKIIRLFVLLALPAIVMFSSCRSTDHAKDFELQAQIRDDFDTAKPIYLVGTKPVDSADAKKMIVDMYRVEIDKYPDSVRCYARVYDSLGYFITNMADPYLKDKNTKYFHKISEELGARQKRQGKVNEFKIREYGAQDSIPYNIVLSVDYSGSMTAVLNTIFEGVELFVGLKLPYDRIALTSFTKTVTIQSELERDTNVLLRKYRAGREKNTGMFSSVQDAAWTSLDLYEKTDSTVPRVLVLFTDGDDNSSKQELPELIARAKRMNVHVFAVAFGYSDDAKLRSLAKHTGGKFYKVYSKKELLAVFKDIYLSLRNYYLITYKPPRYIGFHKVIAQINMPNSTDTVYGYGDYNTSGLDTIGPSFERPILFDFDEYVIKAESFPILDEIADQMYINPRLKIEIQGHTDNVGTAEHNQILSERRAEAVMNALIQRGVEPKRLRSRGFGFSMPKVANDTEENRARNRRTQFQILAR